MLKNINKEFILSFIFVIVVWVFVKEYKIVQDIFLPSIQSIFLAFTNPSFQEKYFTDIYFSCFRVVVSFVLSLLVSVPLGLWMAESRIVRNILAPYLDFIRYLPVPALIPLIILLFGIGETAKIVLLFIGTFFQLVLLVVHSIQSIPSEQLDIIYSLHLRKWYQLKLKFSSILPDLYTSARITLSLCWSYVIIAELIASENGIGYMIKESQRFSNTPIIYIGIFTMGVIGFLSDFFLKKMYPIFFRYKTIKLYDRNSESF